MPLYDFPLWAGDTVRFPIAGFRGAGWKLMAAEVPYAGYGSKAWQRHFESMRKKYRQYSVHSISHGGNDWIAPQIIAEAKSRLAAQRVFQLLTTALTILDGSALCPHCLTAKMGFTFVAEKHLAPKRPMDFLVLFTCNKCQGVWLSNTNFASTMVRTAQASALVILSKWVSRL